MTRSPDLLRIGEVARIFGKSDQWVRLHEWAGNFRYEDGRKIEPMRRLNENGRLTARSYDLEMVEEMTHSLRRGFKINKYQAERALRVIRGYRMIRDQ